MVVAVVGDGDSSFVSADAVRGSGCDADREDEVFGGVVNAPGAPPMGDEALAGVEDAPDQRTVTMEPTCSRAGVVLPCMSPAVSSLVVVRNIFSDTPWPMTP